MRLPRRHCRLPIADCRLTRRLVDPATSSSPVTRHPSPSQRGVALVITIVLLSVILFLTVAFLALMSREKGAVKTSIDQTTARMGAESGLERAKAELIASILNTSNTASFDLIVSTNFINWYGLDPAVTLANGNPLTNVNFAFLFNGNPLDQAQALQNLTNLLYSPRVPVYITNRYAANSVDFRYYLDLNRNRRHDRTGFWPATNDLGGYFTTNGLVTATFAPPNVLSNFFIGDPEWIGGLDRPDKPHGPDNKFLYRYAYIVVPEGKTLDVNFIHNDAKADVVQNGFFRNQGIAPWEINLAAFFRDLNTNVWTYNLYSTNTYPGAASTGTAFDDAYAFWRWRQGTLGQASVQTLFGPPAFGVTAINTDFFDSYTAGPLLASPFGFTVDSDFANGTAANPWPGADTENHYFSTQDFFDPAKTRIGGVAGDQFPERLAYLGTSNSTYNSSTYYRMLAQLGTASTPESSDKLNLNYVNVGGLAATNFIRWEDTNAIQANPSLATANPPLLFFTNVANRLLMKYSEEWLASDYAVYTNLFRMDQPFGVTNIPVVISNQWVFSPAIHRALQLAANIWETKQGTNVFPTVFRPRFQADVAGTNVYIVDFVPVETMNQVAAQTFNRPILDLLSTNNPALAIPADGNVMLYGVPLVVGARKGLPNFNEFASELLVSVTRKLQVRKAGQTITQTNQIFTMEVQMPTGVEFWNSYATNFNRPVSIYVTNVTSMTMTNDAALPGDFTKTIVTGDRILATNNWRAYRALEIAGKKDPKSFITLMRTNVPFLPQTLYSPKVGAGGGFYATNQNVWDDSQQFIMPRWGITISNRVHAMIVDAATQQIIDYVVLGNMTYVTNLTDIISSSASLTSAQFGDAGATPAAFKQLWATNQSQLAPLLSGRLGVIQQINISVGAVARQGQWTSYGKFTPDAPAAAVAQFNNFMYTLVTNGTATVPFTPSFQFRVPLSWQANDPLVHYLAGDLYDTEASGIVALINPASETFTAELKSLAAKNARYQPWPVDATTTPDAYAVDLKDPLVRASDDWQFPTNVMPSIGGLGRVHRGTPWQTVYLKASDLGWTNPAAGMVGWLANLTDASPAVRWRRHTGNRILQEGYYYRPVTDRVLFDVFTSALNDNSTRGRLNINQTNLAAWSAVFSGVAALTNTSELAPIYNPWIIEPAGAYDPFDATTWTPVARLVNGINTLRANPYYFPVGTFQKLGDILAVPELSDASPFLNSASLNARQRALTDAAYEWLPQQTLALLHLDETPRFSIYAYGQSLSPAPESIVTASGTFFGLCTNYAITAEVALRAVVRVEGSPNPAHTSKFLPLNKRYPPRVVVESFNYLPPE